MVEADLEDFRVRGVVIRGRERAVVWDTLARPQDMAGVAELASGLPLSVVYSHGDWDHVWGTRGLSAEPDEIVAHELCLHRFRNEIPKTLREKNEEFPEEFGEVTLVPPNRVFHNALSLKLGGGTLHLHHLPGHTPDTLVGYIPEEGVFLAGDAVETPFPFLTSGSGVGAWAESLEDWSRELEAAEVESLVIPSHGRTGGPEILRINARYLRDLLAGRTPSISGRLTQFYQETHARNQALILER